MDPWINAIEVLLCSAATALTLAVYASEPLGDAEPSGQVQALLRSLNKLLARENSRIKALVEMDTDWWCADGVPFATCEALVAICRNVDRLHTSGLPDIPSELEEALKRSSYHPHSSYHSLPLEFLTTSETCSTDKV